MFFLLFVAFLVIICWVNHRVSVRKFSTLAGSAAKDRNYFSTYISLWSFISALLLLICSYYLADLGLKYYINTHLLQYPEFYRPYLFDTIIKLSQAKGAKLQYLIGQIPKSFDPELALNLAQQYSYYKLITKFGAYIIALSGAIFTALYVLQRYQKQQFKRSFQDKIENLIKILLFVCAIVAIVTTIGIILSLLFEAWLFFQKVGIWDFLFGLQWAPEDADFDPKNSFGSVPLIAGTLMISAIAVVTAIIFGLLTAIFMSEYLPKYLRKFIKPILEILAGIPSIVYGFFAAIYFAPALANFLHYLGFDVSLENALVAGLVIGIMIIPFISSMTDDMLRAIPINLREAAIGLGSMKYEVIVKVLLPAALPAILGAILLATSRAIGETMIVVMAASLAANLTLNPLEPVTTITTQIVMLLQGDQEFDHVRTLSAFALGLLLFLITLLLNFIAIYIINKYKEQYE